MTSEGAYLVRLCQRIYCLLGRIYLGEQDRGDSPFL